MKYAAYTDDSIWSVEATAEEAKAEGLATMQDLDVPADEVAGLKVAPISDELAVALAEAEASGGDVMFDLVNGTLVVDHDEAA